MTSLADKQAHLELALRDMGRVIVAYSGGVDSAFLLAVAHDMLGKDAVGLIADSPSLARREFRDATTLAADIGAELIVVRTQEMDDPHYASNPRNRCYFCKSELFTVCNEKTKALGFPWVAYGANMDDLGDFRPGQQAAHDFGVRAPLIEAELHKADIRALAKERGLPVWDKPNLACLSSRFPTGVEITPERLRLVEDAEYVLLDAGFRQVRVRYLGELARVEIGTDELPRLAQESLREDITGKIKALGFAAVEFDPHGYRTGSLNAAASNNPTLVHIGHG